MSFVTNLNIAKHRRLAEILVSGLGASLVEIADGLVRVNVPLARPTAGTGEDHTEGAQLLASALSDAQYVPLQWEHPSAAAYSLSTLVVALTERETGIRPDGIITRATERGTVYVPQSRGRPVRVDKMLLAEIVNSTDLAAAEGHIAYAHPLATLALATQNPEIRPSYVQDSLDCPILLAPLGIELEDEIAWLDAEGWWLEIGRAHV